uniref:Uncharacterized protein n=1 Tax=Tetradesmus obliquus TaxID=3088 RepID=A0A383VBC1_TETOB|eukprot:jgi/Sobl393_1/11517/SZX62059.1
MSTQVALEIDAEGHSASDTASVRSTAVQKNGNNAAAIACASAAGASAADLSAPEDASDASVVPAAAPAAAAAAAAAAAVAGGGHPEDVTAWQNFWGLVLLYFIGLPFLLPLGLVSLLGKVLSWCNRYFGKAVAARLVPVEFKYTFIWPLAGPFAYFKLSEV